MFQLLTDWKLIQRDFEHLHDFESQFDWMTYH